MLSLIETPNTHEVFSDQLDGPVGRGITILVLLTCYKYLHLLFIIVILFRGSGVGCGMVRPSSRRRVLELFSKLGALTVFPKLAAPYARERSDITEAGMGAQRQMTF